MVFDGFFGDVFSACFDDKTSSTDSSSPTSCWPKTNKIGLCAVWVAAATGEEITTWRSAALGFCQLPNAGCRRSRSTSSGWRQRESGSWATVKWLIGKDGTAHVSGDSLVGDIRESQGCNQKAWIKTGPQDRRSIRGQATSKRIRGIQADQCPEEGAQSKYQKGPGCQK